MGKQCWSRLSLGISIVLFLPFIVEAKECNEKKVTSDLLLKGVKEIFQFSKVNNVCSSAKSIVCDAGTAKVFDIKTGKQEETLNLPQIEGIDKSVLFEEVDPETNKVQQKAFLLSNSGELHHVNLDTGVVESRDISEVVDTENSTFSHDTKTLEEDVENENSDQIASPAKLQHDAMKLLKEEDEGQYSQASAALKNFAANTNFNVADDQKNIQFKNVSDSSSAVTSHSFEGSKKYVNSDGSAFKFAAEPTGKPAPLCSDLTEDEKTELSRLGKYCLADPRSEDSKNLDESSSWKSFITDQSIPALLELGRNGYHAVNLYAKNLFVSSNLGSYFYSFSDSSHDSNNSVANSEDSVGSSSQNSHFSFSFKDSAGATRAAGDTSDIDTNSDAGGYDRAVQEANLADLMRDQRINELARELLNGSGKNAANKLIQNPQLGSGGSRKNGSVDSQNSIDLPEVQDFQSWKEARVKERNQRLLTELQFASGSSSSKTNSSSQRPSTQPDSNKKKTTWPGFGNLLRSAMLPRRDQFWLVA